jgi:signal transduction histidine kinase
LNDFKQKDEEGQKKYINFEIRIKDSGCGISKENLGKLFLNFGRLEEHQKSNERGTGLGLSICKSLLEKMGGTVMVESDGPGKGTTFIIKMQAKCKVQRRKAPLTASRRNAPVETSKKPLTVKHSVIR